MKEIKDILRAYDEAEKQGKQTALVTVVQVEGSSYRQPGARMLVTEDGMLTGAISGGCLEGDALRKALLAITGKKAMLVTYDTSDEDDAILGMGLGCNGIIQVLIEPIDKSNSANPIALLKAVAEKRAAAVLVTIFSIANRMQYQPGTCILVKEDRIIGGNPVSINSLLVDANEAMRKRMSSFKNHTSSAGEFVSFIEFIPPAVSLIIVGAGNDVQPLVKMANILGWETTVADGRANYVKAERFPSCNVFLSKPEDVLKRIVTDEQTVFALMTHNYNYDMAMLKELLRRKVGYIGILGPKKKRDRMLQELKESGFVLTGEQLSAIHGPIGLDIGAETAEEIALSILAEIKAVLSGKEGSPLKHKADTIHSRTTSVE